MIIVGNVAGYRVKNRLTVQWPFEPTSRSRGNECVHVIAKSASVVVELAMFASFVGWHALMSVSVRTMTTTLLPSLVLLQVLITITR